MKAELKQTNLLNDFFNNINKYKFYLRMLSIGKNISIELPGNWTINKVSKFITTYYKNDVKENELNFIFQGKPIIENSISIEDLCV
jgi:hypothetical protein